MARQRDDDDFDDEDYLPPRRQQREPGRSRATLFGLLGGLAVVALVVAGLFVFVIRSTRQVMERERQAAMAELPRINPPAVPPPENVPPGNPGANWAKMVGPWSRQPTDKEEGGYPIRFEFRKDFTCTTTRVHPDRQPTWQESRVEVLADDGDSVRLKLHDRAGVYGYSFRLKPDDTLVLDDGKGGLVFTRPK